MGAAGRATRSPTGCGGTVAPYRFESLETPDVPHSWGAIHEQWNGGAMDGFYTNAGIWALGYYTAAELPFYYSLHETSTLAVNFFCSQLGPTWPNRFYHMAGTSGGITTNGVWGYGIFDYPMILDLLDAAGVTWKIYSLGMDSVPYGNTDNVAVFWKNFVHDQRTLGSKGGIPQRRPQGPPAAGLVRRSRATPAAGTSTRLPTCRSGWVSRRS